MQESTSAPPASKSDRSSWGVLLVVVGAAALVLVLHPNQVVFDQLFINRTVQQAGYPSLASGVLSLLFVSVLQLLHPASLLPFNTFVRLFAMLLYLLPIFLLYRQSFARREGTWVALAFTLASGYPFLWLSTELFAGGMLALSIVAMLRERSPMLVGVLLALTSHVKPDLLLVALVLLLAYLARRELAGRRRQGMLAFFAAWAALVLPGFLTKGSAYFKVGRQFLSFGQHYSALFFPHQLNARQAHPMTPWYKWKVFMRSSFPGAKSVLDVVTMYPRRYVDFLALSMVTGIFTTVHVFKYLLLLALLKLALQRRQKIEPVPFDRVFGLSLTGFIPFVALAYPHIRYLARYYPLFIVYCLSFAETALSRFGEGRYKILRAITIAVVSVALLDKALDFATTLLSLKPDAQFYFPD